jgi:hypothetical protein
MRWGLAGLIIVWVLILFVACTLNARDAHAGQSACGRYHGRDYVICSESGPAHMPHGLAPGTPHRGRSSATGPCGMVYANRVEFGGDDLAACGRYRRARYPSWADAERHHRQLDWW